MLAGATLRERIFSCLGALIGIGLTGLLCGLILGNGPHVPLLVAPMGASAVLLFAVPSSPLAQPWSIIGGNTLSAFCGFMVASLVHDPVAAAGIAVAVAIAVMSVTRCLHPPGGAAALTAVFGGPVVASWGVLFPLVPVALNSCILVGLGLLFHRLSRRSYPHVAPSRPGNTHGTADTPPPLRVGVRNEDIDAALTKLDETFDIGRDDIERLLREVERQVLAREHGELTCADIMSRDVITIPFHATRDDAVSLLIRHNVRILPVTDEGGRVVGTVGLRELIRPGDGLGDALSAPATASPASRAIDLLPVLTDGRTHAVIITAMDRRVLGLISQTDLLGAMGRLSLTARGPAGELAAAA
ncbi:HPP family protein [Chelatococcus reniformis]|uniref:HPP family protein n=1 Tax=Chelatococcus reniformis TaxID=1494448 RepID=UPI001FCEB61C